MRDAVIVSAVRTAVGKAPKGTLRTTRPDEMGAAVIKEAVARVPGLELTAVEDVMMG
jgi:acetyl-CoA acyltransferase